MIKFNIKSESKNVFAPDNCSLEFSATNKDEALKRLEKFLDLALGTLPDKSVVHDFSYTTLNNIKTSDPNIIRPLDLWSAHSINLSGQGATGKL